MTCENEAVGLVLTSSLLFYDVIIIIMFIMIIIFWNTLLLTWEPRKRIEYYGFARIQKDPRN